MSIEIIYKSLLKKEEELVATSFPYKEKEFPAHIKEQLTEFFVKSRITNPKITNIFALFNGVNSVYCFIETESATTRPLRKLITAKISDTISLTDIRLIEGMKEENFELRIINADNVAQPINYEGRRYESQFIPDEFKNLVKFVNLFTNFITKCSSVKEMVVKIESRVKKYQDSAFQKIIDHSPEEIEGQKSVFLENILSKYGLKLDEEQKISFDKPFDLVASIKDLDEIIKHSEFIEEILLSSLKERIKEYNFDIYDDESKIKFTRYLPDYLTQVFIECNFFEKFSKDESFIFDIEHIADKFVSTRDYEESQQKQQERSTRQDQSQFDQEKSDSNPQDSLQLTAQKFSRLLSESKEKSK